MTSPQQLLAGGTSDRIVDDQKAAAGLGLRPPTGGHELQDGHALAGRVVGASVRKQCRHAGVLDRDFLA
jgi:hypothetical protein